MLAKNCLIHKRTSVSCLNSVLMSLWFNCSKRYTFFFYFRREGFQKERTFKLVLKNEKDFLGINMKEESYNMQWEQQHKSLEGKTWGVLKTREKKMWLEFRYILGYVVWWGSNRVRYRKRNFNFLITRWYMYTESCKSIFWVNSYF